MSMEYNPNKLSLILVRVVDALSTNKHQWQRPGPRRFWRTLGAGNIRDIPYTRVRIIYVFSITVFAPDVVIAMNVRLLFRD